MRAIHASRRLLGLWYFDEPRTGFELRDLATGASLGRREMGSDLWLVSPPVIAPDGQSVFVSSFRGEAFLWQPENKVLKTLKGGDSLGPKAFFPGGKDVAGIGPGGLRFWDIETGAARGPFGGNLTYGGMLLISPDGRSVLTASNEDSPQGGTLCLWEVATGKERLRLRGPRRGLGAFSPDGRVVVCSNDQGGLEVWDLKTGKKRGAVSGHRGGVTQVAISPDRAWIFSGGSDATILVWDARQLLLAREPGPKLTPRRRVELWDSLAGEDAAKAYQSLMELADSPEQSVPFLRDRLRKGAAAALANVPRWIADLDDDKFATRRKAAEALARLGRLAAPALRQALNDDPPAESRRALEALLQKLAKGEPSAAELQALRGLEALDRCATPEARRALQELRSGAKKK